MSRIIKKNIKGQIARVNVKTDQGLFFIAIVPPADIQAEITQLKEEVRDKYGSKHALNAPPHITLHMPFKWKMKKVDLLTEAMHNMSSGLDEFDIQLMGFNAFAPRVIYVDVAPNEALRSLQRHVVTIARRQLGLDNSDYKNRGFHPHVTIAFRDLKKAKFEEAWNDFKQRNFDATFSVGSLMLLKHEDGKWSSYREFPFAN